MTVPFSNLEDIIYSHNEEMAREIFDFLVAKGYTTALSSSVIQTGTHGEQVVKRLDVHKKKNHTDMFLRSLNPYNFRHGKENPKIMGIEIYTPENLNPRPCFKVLYESDNTIDYVAHSDVVKNYWEIFIKWR